MEVSKVCNPTLGVGDLTSLSLFSWPQSMWLKTWSFYFEGNDLLTGYCTRGSARGGIDLRVRSCRWGSPASPSLATNRRQSRRLLWKLLRVSTSSFCYTLCFILNLHTKIEKRNHESETYGSLLYLTYTAIWCYRLWVSHAFKPVFSISCLATFWQKNSFHDLRSGTRARARVSCALYCRSYWPWYH